LGRAKPEPSYFTEVVDRLGVSVDDVLFLDDHPANVDGARQAGLNAELFPRGGGVSALAPVLAAYGLSIAP
jgi:putative hydrolase of the HAD superfamily